MKNCLLLILTLALSLSAFGQKAKTTQDLEKQLATFDNNQLFRVAYNAMEGSTLVLYGGGFDMLGGKVAIMAAPLNSVPALPKTSEKPMLRMGASFDFKGQTLKKSIREYGIYFTCGGYLCNSIAGANPVVTADEKTFQIGKGGSNPLLMPAINTKILVFKVTSENLMQLGNAKTATIRFGNLLLMLKPEHLRMFADMAELGSLSE